MNTASNLTTPTPTPTPTLLPPNLLLSTPSVASPLQTSSPASPLESPSPLPKFSSRSSIDIENGKRIDGLDEHGFIYITVKGDAESRGFAQGFLLADRIVKFIRTYAFFLWTEYGRDITFFTKMIKDLFGPIVLEQYNECYLEMKGIAHGVLDKISKLKTKQGKDEYFTEGAVEGNKIVLPADSHLDYSNLAYNNPSQEEKEKYTKEGKILINIDFDIIFLLNCVVSVDYVYSKLTDIFNSNKSLKSSSIYKEYFRSLQPVAASTESSGKSRNFFSLFGRKKPAASVEGGADRCSAFMAVGDKYVAGGGIICAHITFDNFVMGQFDNIILFMDTSVPSTTEKPSYNILMQTFPGSIFSSTDFFVTSANMMVTETTIGGFNAFELHAPSCVRCRKAMQYSGTLDEYVKNLRENNSGDYANTWYVGHTLSKDSNGKQRPEIMRIELGLRYVHVEKKTNGYFIGFNACYDPRIRNLECKNDGFFDIRRHSGARRVTLDMKIKEYTQGEKRISATEAQLIISSHWDIYLEKDNNPCSRTICSHYELDKREYISQESRPKPYQPRGSVDGKICSSDLCNKMQFLARWGNACGTDFKKDDFCNLHAQWEYQRAYLEDRLRKPWVVCTEVNIKNPNAVMSTAIKVYDFSTGSAIGSTSAKGSVSTNATISKPLSPVTYSLPAPVTATLPAVPALAPAISSPLPSPSILPSLSSPKPTIMSTPTPTSVPRHTPTPTTALTLDNKNPELINNNSISYDDELFAVGGGSNKLSQEFDNNKELKEFIKMFKKQNRKSYKSKNSNTRRNKKNDK
jgi:hypothetical protein